MITHTNLSHIYSSQSDAYRTNPYVILLFRILTVEEYHFCGGHYILVIYVFGIRCKAFEMVS